MHGHGTLGCRRHRKPAVTVLSLPRFAQGLLTALLLATAPAFALKAPEPPRPYVLDAALDLVTLLPPPPAAGSAADRDDLAQVLAIQQSRSEAELALAKADAEASVFRFADTLGEAFNAEKLPRTAALFERLTKSIGAKVNPVKDHWNRARPFLASSAVQPQLRPDGATYPSGHGALARLYALVLSDLLPAQRRAIFERADRFARGRLVLGVHYPTDVEAGATAASVILAELRRQEEFRADFAAARQELATWQPAKAAAATESK